MLDCPALYDVKYVQVHKILQYMVTHVLRELRAASEEFGSRLREERKRLGLTQARLASDVGISTPTQVGYELGIRTPDAHYLTVVEQLGADEHYIRTGVHANRAAVETMDWEFFLALQRAGDAWFKNELGITLNRRKSNEIARFLYEVLIDTHKIEYSKVAHVLRLVAQRK